MAWKEQVIDLLSEPETAGPAVEAIGEILLSCGPTVRKLLAASGTAIVDITDAMFSRYVNEYDFSRSEAMLLTLSNKVALAEAMNSSKTQHS
jgi:hypothetical protein